MSEPLDVDRLADVIAGRVAERLRLDAERLLTRDDLAARLDVAPRTIAGMVSRGELPGPLLHTGGLARWRWEDVTAWLKSRAGRKPRRGRGRWDRSKVTGNGEANMR